MNSTLNRTLLTLLSLWMFSNSAVAQTPTFGAPEAPLPAMGGTGLNGFLWNSPAIEPVDDLAVARAYIAANPADGTFTATVIDYPDDRDSTSTEELISAVLGVDAPSLSPASLGTVPVLNSILQFKGFLRVDAAGTLMLGLGSDDGSDLLIQGTQVINNDGLHGFPVLTLSPWNSPRRDCTRSKFCSSSRRSPHGDLSSISMRLMLARPYQRRCCTPCRNHRLRS